MTLKDFKVIIDAIKCDDCARVYIEQEVGANVYLQTEVENVRKEISDMGSYLIITGTISD